MTDQSTEAVWTGQVLVSLYWRPDGYGKAGRALYARDLYLGQVMHVPTHPRRQGQTWRAWLMTTDEGEEVGWYPTEQAAKDALVDAAFKGLGR